MAPSGRPAMWATLRFIRLAGTFIWPAVTSTCISRTVSRPSSGRPVPARPAACPYPGLAAFGTDDAEWFFGRDRLTAELVVLLADLGQRGGMLMLVAPSGAGKSSLIQAGLIPAVRRGALPMAGSADWPLILFTPTAHPLAAARAADLPEPGGPESGRFLVVVDQLEELFTLAADESERREFIDWLWQLSRGDESGVPQALVVCGLRADFYAECANYPQLRDALATSQVFIGPMTQAELRQAIRFPALAAGLRVEDGLVELLLRDLGGDRSSDAGNYLAVGEPTGRRGRDYDAGRLPFLAHALQATWQQRAGHILTVAKYEETGGISHAIAITAERCFGRLQSAAQTNARAVFRRRCGSTTAVRTSAARSAARTCCRPAPILRASGPCSTPTPRADCSPSPRTRSRSPTRR